MDAVTNAMRSKTFVEKGMAKIVFSDMAIFLSALS